MIKIDKLNELQKELPQLVVALDSKDDTANYIHIADVKESVDYYCPCCKGLIRPRAYKKDKDYMVQPHFYHESGGCSEESFVHYICKTWLFEEGCKFKVSGIEYTVDSIETEKTLHTSFGDYRPDIIVNTENGKTFYFEIRYSNKKNEVYAPKWDELGNDVVEVDTREFINNKHDNSIPKFKLIYSDGVCFIKGYSRTDYEETIAKIKEYWKNRQNKINYKILWEKLDWFWVELQKYKEDEVNQEDLLSTFRELQFYDMGMCWELVFNKSACFKDIKADIRSEINHRSKEEFSKYVEEMKERLEGIATISGSCKEKRGLEFSCKINKIYTLLDADIHHYVSFDIPKWIVLPRDVLCFIKKLKDIEVHINKHLLNYDILKEKFSNNLTISNGLMLLGSDASSIRLLKCLRELYLDVDLIYSEVSSWIAKNICDYYERNITTKPKYITECIEGALPDYFRIKENNTFENYGYGINGWNISAMNGVIDYCIDILTDEDHKKYIEINNSKFYYDLTDRNSFCSRFSNEIHKLFSNIDTLEKNEEIIVDITRFSNNTWKFDVNGENSNIIITLIYYTKVWEEYLKRICIKREIPVSYECIKSGSINDYKKNVISFMNNNFLEVMKDMVNTEIDNYNLTHFNSRMCLSRR